MKQFQQTLDGVGIYVDDERYVDTLDNFASDYGQPAPPLPDAMTSRVYEPFVRHAINQGASLMQSGPMPWGEGDDIIGSLGDLLSAQQARTEAADADANDPDPDDA